MWNRWYLNRIGHATGVPAGAPDPERIRAAVQPGGYLEDGAAEDWSRLATTAAGLEVLSDNDIRVDQATRQRISGWLDARAAELTNPYQACTLRAATRALGLADPAAIRAQAGLGDDDRLLVTGVDELAGRAELDPATLAKAALTRRATGQSDSALDRRALIALSGAVPAEITKEAATRWVNLRQLQIRLAPDLPLPRLTDWRPTNRAERLTAWRLLGLTSDAAPPRLRAELATLPGLLTREAGALSLRELRAGVESLRRNNIPAPTTAIARAVTATCPPPPTRCG
ncbi:hypothetical protein [Crossiella cryophila]|uniref:Uncharacterized protein n=1 Tax=Crossiella cryophila TaxID=43355 RepID=A0A7W7FV29_9PSEU|nr:hypothetical protein [Crossiella cryophila]MBB4678083.1 hypothetical protein [Crossiella cryophila]